MANERITTENHNKDLWQDIYSHWIKEGKSHKDSIEYANQVAGPPPPPVSDHSQKDDTEYYRTNKGIYVRVTGSHTFEKAAWVEGDLALTKEELTIKTCEEVFSSDPWRPTTKKRWDEVFEPLSKAGTGIRNKKPMVFVFECGGKKYFKYKNELDMPEGRRREMEAVWLEFSSQADRDYLQKIPEAILACINHNPVKLSEIAQIASDMDQRLKMTFDFGLYEKLASVLYFDLDEDTSVWDPAYNNVKIAHWRKHGGMDFFLSMPIGDYLPKEFSSKPGLDTYLEREKIKVELLRGRLGQLFNRLSTGQKENS